EILEVLLAAVEAGFGTPAIDAAIRRGAGLLAVTQRENGMWERETAPRRALTGWRVLRHALSSEADGTRGGSAARQRRSRAQRPTSQDASRAAGAYAVPHHAEAGPARAPAWPLLRPPPDSLAARAPSPPADDPLP